LSPILLMMYGKSSEFFLGVSHSHKGKFVSNVELYSSNAYMCGCLVVGMDLEIFLDVHILSSILWK
jgi:hypothetical protein